MTTAELARQLAGATCRSADQLPHSRSHWKFLPFQAASRRPPDARTKTSTQRNLRICKAAAEQPESYDIGVGRNVQAGILARDNIQWKTATIVENRAECADGSLRTLVLSVEDHVNYLDGRKVKDIQETPRWIDAYQVPGMFVGMRYTPEGSSDLRTVSKLVAISSSPYDARRDSALLDASIIEVLVDRHAGEDGQQLGVLGPGALLQVSQAMGRGYASLFNGYVGLLSTLEERRNLLLIGAGSQGIGPLRAVLQWTPVQAHATAHTVALFYAAAAPTCAGYLQEWDQWREAGVQVEPCYVPAMAQSSASANGSSPAAAAGAEGRSSDACKQAVQDALESAIFGRGHGLMGAVGGDPRDCAVLISGLPGSAAAHFSRLLTTQGVARERILFCDFF